MDALRDDSPRRHQLPGLEDWPVKIRLVIAAGDEMVGSQQPVEAEFVDHDRRLAQRRPVRVLGPQRDAELHRLASAIAASYVANLRRMGLPAQSGASLTHCE